MEGKASLRVPFPIYILQPITFDILLLSKRTGILFGGLVQGTGGSNRKMSTQSDTATENIFK